MSILEHIGKTPLVRLRRVANGCRNAVWAKCEHLNPGGSVKDRMALAIVDGAEQSGQLQPGSTLVEATAGNTGMGLALVAAVRGYKLVCVMPEKMSVDKRRSLHAMGAEVVITDNAPLDDERNFRNVAQRIARERGGFLTDQFANLHNPQVHERTTGPEIWQQCNGAVAAFVAGMGTGGSITGIGRFLKSQSPATRIVLADPAGSRMANLINCGELGPDGSYLVEGIGSSAPTPILDLGVIDSAEIVSDEASFTMAKRLAQEEGLLVGASAGTAVVAALRIAQRTDIDGPVVALLPDHWDRYQTTMLDENWLQQKLPRDGAQAHDDGKL
jgi:cysteine synthase